MKHTVITIGMFFLVQLVFPQKVMQKQWDAVGVSLLKLSSSEVYTITVETKATDVISVITKVEGETYENVMVSSYRKENALVLSTAYRPYFVAENDKLAAHKVIAIEMHLVIPEDLTLAIDARIASVQVTGSFQNLEIQLENGNCGLLDFLGNATLHTKNGYIHVSALKDVSGTAITREGTIINTLPHKGLFHVEAESITGDIILRQTQ